MIVDVHTHIWTASPQMMVPPNVSAPGEPGPPLDATPEAHRHAAEPVDISIIHGLNSLHAGVSVTHQQVAAAVQKWPENLIGFGGLDPLAPDLNESLEEAISLGLVGVTISAAGQAMHPCHTRAMGLYETCEKRTLPIIAHGSTLFGHKAFLEYARPELLSEVARCFPKLRLVVTEIGRPWIEATLCLMRQQPHVYADVSGLVNEPWQLYNALWLAQQYGVDHKLLFASGFPFLTPRQTILNLYSINHLVQGTNLPKIQRQLLQGIVERDAASLLGIDLPHKHQPQTTQGAEGDEKGEPTGGKGSQEREEPRDETWPESAAFSSNSVQ